MTLLLLWCCLQDPEAKAAAFVDEMRTEDITVRRKALDGILAIGKPAVPALLRALADETPGLKERVDGLVGKFSSKEWKERDEAMRSLVRLGRRAMDFLKSVGFTKVKNLRGGIIEWIDRVDPSQPKY